ncbi:hypothetical protein [Brachyspira pilosicoli]|uniref:hypothetical protein n=1 Tax=Brachyspira pilosicoli TaxID=52584 RepID=UPI003004A08C
MNKFLKIYAVIAATLVFIIFILFIAGNFNRKAYLSEFKFDDTHITKTLKLNNLNADEIKKIFINTNDNIIDNNALTNYIFTNEAITNYSYGFRVKYYSKIFRNSDIYGVYPNIAKIIEDNSYIREIKMDDDGSPFGNLISEKKIDDEKIDNIYYKVKLKFKFIITIFAVLLAVLLVYYLSYYLIINRLKIIYFFNNLKSLIFKYKFMIIRIYSLFIILFIVITSILLIISKFEKKVSLSNFELITESPVGYVYKANFPKTSVFQYSEEPLRIKNKPYYIKNYGYSIEITNKPEGYDNSNEATNWNNKDGSFTVVNSTGWNSYPYIIYLSKGEHYRVSIEAKRISGQGGDIKYYLDDRNMNVTIPDSRSISTNDYSLYISDKYIYNTYVGQYPNLTFYFPYGEINIKYIKLEQITDNLFIKENSFTIFTSSVKLDNNESFEVYCTNTFNIKEALKVFLFMIIIYLLLFILLFDFLSKLKNIFLEKKKLIFKVYAIILISFSILVILFYFIGKIYREAELTNFEIVYDTPAGYVYKAKVEPKSLLKPNFLYRYSDAPLKIENKPDYIKNYGYALEINRIPDWYDKNNKNIIYSNKINEFSIYNPYDYNWNAYNNTIKVSVGEKYSMISEMKGTTEKAAWHKTIFISLDDYNKNISIPPTNENILVYDKELSNNKYMFYSNYIEIYDLPYTQNNNNLTVMFPNNSKLDIKYIKIEQVGGLYIKDNQYIVFTSDRKIDNFANVYYNLSINNYIIVIFLILLIPCLIFLLNRISLNNFQFSILSFILVTLLAIFHYWLCYPGNFHNWDVWGSMIEGVRGNYYSNWHPVLISFTLHILYKIFGYDTHYLFTINILLFYIGLYILIISIYYKVKNIYVLILLLIPFIPHFFFVGIINHVKDFGATNYIWLSYILIFYWYILNSKSNKINIIIIFVFIMLLIAGMLWRHNFIVLVYPMFILFTYKILKIFHIKNKLKYFLNFIRIMFVFAVLLVLIYTSFPIIINSISGNEYKTLQPDNAVKFLQIAACAVTNNDDSMIPKEWYMKDKTFEDLKNTFNKNPYNSDIFYFIQQDIDPFYDRDLQDVSKVMFKYILKYPLTYIKYKYEYLKLCWNVPSYEKVNVYYIQYHLFKYDLSYLEYLHGYFDNSPSGITFNDLRGKIYSNLYKLIPEIPILYYIILSIIIFLISSILLILRYDSKDNILLFTFCVSVSALAINFIVVLYSPVALYRYMYPIIPLSVISLISFIVFIIDKKHNKNT